MKSIAAYLDWHYLEILPLTIIIWRNAVLFPFYYFSIPLHLKTLFSPWKRQGTKMGPGFDFGEFLYVIGFNLTSRLMGVFLRMMTICCGFIFMLFTGMLFFLLPIIWPLIP